MASQDYTGKHTLWEITSLRIAILFSYFNNQQAVCLQASHNQIQACMSV